MKEISEELKLKIWKQAREVDGYDKDQVRKDACGAFMIYDKYAITDDIYGWQIDHICPRAILEELGYNEDEIDNIVNLRAMNWRNNNSKSDDYPSYTSVITSEGNTNVEREEYRIVNKSLQEKLEQLYPNLKNRKNAV